MGRANILTLFVAAITATVFVLVSADVVFVGDSAIFEVLRLENESQQRYFGAFDLTVPVILGSVFLLSAGLLIFRKLCECTAALMILPATALLVWLPKVLIDRPRPEGPLEGASNSFPSGTAAVSLMVLGLLIYLIGLFIGPRWLRITMQLLLGLGIMILGIFRILASEHYPTDLLGGYLVGVLGLIVIAWLYRKMIRRALPENRRSPIST